LPRRQRQARLQSLAVSVPVPFVLTEPVRDQARL
jgi:hypothetical protein